eukprot:g27314.t1
MTFDCKTIEITHRAVCEQEAEVLRTLNWEVDGPCIEQWLYIYSVRFEKLTDITKMRRHPDLKMLRAFVLISARAILMSESFAPMLSQGDLALGLFCLSLMLDGYLPLTSLKPEEVDEADWCESMSILNAGNQPGGCETCRFVSPRIMSHGQTLTGRRGSGRWCIQQSLIPDS